MDKRDRPCSGTFCQISRNWDAKDCCLKEECDHYMPIADTSGMKAVVDMAMLQFGIDVKDRQKLEILFNAYVSQYMAEFCRLS